MARIPPSLMPKVRAKFNGHRTLVRHSQYTPPRLEAIVREYSETLQKLYNSVAKDSSQR